MRFVNVTRVVLHLLGLALIFLAVIGPMTTEPGDLALRVTLDCTPGASGQQQCTANSPGLVTKTENTLSDLAVPLTGAGLALELVAIGMAPGLWPRRPESVIDQLAGLDPAEQVHVPAQPVALGRKETPARQAGRWFNG